MGIKIKPKDNYHGLGIELFLRVIAGLDDVTLAYRGTKYAKDESRRENYFLLITLHKDKDGNTIMVPVHVEKQGQYNRVMIDTNKIATVFGKRDINKYIQKEVIGNNLVRIKKEVLIPVNGRDQSPAVIAITLPIIVYHKIPICQQQRKNIFDTKQFKR